MRPKERNDFPSLRFLDPSAEMSLPPVWDTKDPGTDWGWRTQYGLFWSFGMPGRAQLPLLTLLPSPGSKPSQLSKTRHCQGTTQPLDATLADPCSPTLDNKTNPGAGAAFNPILILFLLKSNTHWAGPCQTWPALGPVSPRFTGPSRVSLKHGLHSRKGLSALETSQLEE